MSQLPRAFAILAASAALVTAADLALAGKPPGSGGVTITDLGELTPGGGSSAYSINELGEIVGTAMSASGIQVRPIWKEGAVVGYLEGANGTPYTWNSLRHAVGEYVVNTKISCSRYWTPTSSGPLPPLPGGDNGATGGFDVNENGEMAGAAQSFDGVVRQTRPVTWRNGAIDRDLGMPPGAIRAEGAGINNQGDLVGNMTDAAGRINAFLYRNGEYRILPPLTTRFATYAIDINNNGDVLGTSDGGWPVVWKSGATAPTALPIPEGRYPREVWHINDNGDVVGTVTALPPAFNSAALWRGGKFIDLGILPGGTESYARGINNAGVIVGASTRDQPYGWRAVTWTVAPTGPSKPPRR